MKFNEWKQRRKLAYKLYRGLFNDANLPHTIENQHDLDALQQQVVDFFKNGSELIYPAKYVFCNIVYSYYLNKYFQVPFYEALDNRETLFDSPCPLLYHQAKQLYDNVIEQVIDDIESLPSTTKTRHYFKMEFLIADEDISDVIGVKFV